MRIGFWRCLSLVAFVAMVAIGGFNGVAWALVFEAVAGPFDFDDSEYSANFTELRRGADINDDGAVDLGGTGHTALNFTGGAGPAGDVWLTVFTGGTEPELETLVRAPRGSIFDGLGGICITGDVLIHTYNNTKGAGFVALYNSVRPTLLEDGSDSGLGIAVILYDQGNSDALQLATVDQASNKIGKLKAVSLGSGIGENAWYRLVMSVSTTTDESLHVEAKVFRHTIPTDPNSLPSTQVGGTLVYDGSLPSELRAAGEVGIAASAFSTNVDTSVTNFFARDHTPKEECSGEPKS